MTDFVELLGPLNAEEMLAAAARQVDNAGSASNCLDVRTGVPSRSAQRSA